MFPKISGSSLPQSQYSWSQKGWNNSKQYDEVKVRKKGDLEVNVCLFNLETTQKPSKRLSSCFLVSKWFTRLFLGRAFLAFCKNHFRIDCGSGQPTVLVKHCYYDFRKQFFLQLEISYILPK